MLKTRPIILTQNDSDTKPSTITQFTPKNIYDCLDSCESEEYKNLVEIKTFKKAYSDCLELAKKINAIDKSLITMNGAMDDIRICKNKSERIHVNPKLFAHILKHTTTHGIYEWTYHELDVFIRLCEHLNNVFGEDFTLSEKEIEQWFDTNETNETKIISLRRTTEPYFEEWKALKNSYSVMKYHMNFLKEMFLNLCKYETTVGSYYLVRRRNELIGCLNFDLERLNNSHDKLLDDMMYVDLIQSKGIDKTMSYFPEFNFKRVFRTDPFSYKALNSMHCAAESIPGAKKWIQTSNDHWSSEDSKIRRQISEHPMVDACGHSGASWYWTKNNLRNVYTNGWNQWTRKYLANQGISLLKKGIFSFR